VIPKKQPSRLFIEAKEAAQRVIPALTAQKAVLSAIKSEYLVRSIPAIYTIARGSSDHAASFFAYLMMSLTGRPVTTLPMSLITVENASILAKDCLAFAFSQSGKSPDIVQTLQYFSDRQALTVSCVNQLQSPLSDASRFCLQLDAGQELSVAASKSFIAQLVTSAHIVSTLADDLALLSALNALPTELDRAFELSWAALNEAMQTAKQHFVLSRGLGMSIAQEAALKLKETCGIHAEAFSIAEFKHGPMALANSTTLLLVFAPRGPAQAGIVEAAFELAQRGAKVWIVVANKGSHDQQNLTLGSPVHQLPCIPAQHLALDSVLMIQSFYRFVEQLAWLRGRDPDQPKNLSKVTQTL
jgi:glutamine---fructose-6-phosphate transaminase (isomerizing)